jgi:hypothetical protein
MPCRSAAELRGLAEVAVVQAADFWTLHDLARRGELDGPRVGRVLVEREVRARLTVISVAISASASCIGGLARASRPWNT